MKQPWLPGSSHGAAAGAGIAAPGQGGEEERHSLDIQFCWEQVLRVQPCFRLTCQYANPDQRYGLLALSALLAALEEAYCGPSDETVSLAKLAWWQHELLYSEVSANSHPITRQMNRAGMLEKWRGEMFPGLLGFWLERSESSPPADVGELRLLCERIGWQAITMELSLQAETVPDDSLPVLQAEAAISGMVQLFRESCRSVRLGYSWIPLDLRARYGLSRSDLTSPGRANAIGPLLRELCQLGLGWRRNIDLRTGAQSVAHPIEGQWRRRNRHLLTRFSLASQQLACLQARELTRYRKQFSRVSLGEALAAWRGARSAVAGHRWP